jgi:hypothetical protein
MNARRTRRSPINVVTWKWGATPFGARHVNTLRAMLARHLHVDHELVLITDDPADVDSDVRIVPMPPGFTHTPRCRRRMQLFSWEFTEQHEIGARVLAIDLDVVIVDDLTDIVSRPEPICGWKVGHAGVYSGSFLLFDAGALDGAWQLFAADPVGYPKRVQAHGTPSDQAMVNHWLQTQPPIFEWTERDGFVTYYGRGYERLEHLGVGPNRPQLPASARIVVLGSADLAVLDDPSVPWIAEHYMAFDRRAA